MHEQETPVVPTEPQPEPQEPVPTEPQPAPSTEPPGDNDNGGEE